MNKMSNQEGELLMLKMIMRQHSDYDISASLDLLNILVLPLEGLLDRLEDSFIKEFREVKNILSNRN